MAIQCWMCSEILVEDKELAEAQPPAPPGFSRSKAVSVHSGCCPECLGLLTGGALRLRALENHLTAA